ncbi:hypothetical protein DID76_02925 [Candidatus Marinamargulisbacteria bacterium SCGC AG-414-C22]|nr:hypothetical protein DID76_02925 [Candidatus Marinamargulisbacteria bacterium SCGC AG-414-C22]
MTKKKSLLLNHSLFKEQHIIHTKEDLNQKKIERYGDKIICDIPLTQIEVKPQVRKTFDNNKIALLAEDIDAKGLIHPITLMKHPTTTNLYILLIGGNRFEAFKQLKKTTIPAIIKSYSNNEGDIQLLQLAENMHRNDLNPVELAEALTKIKNLTGLTLEQIAKTVGRTVDSIKQYSRISKLSESEKAFHIKKKSTKNDILNYLAQRQKSTKSTSLTQKNSRKRKLELDIKKAEEIIKKAKAELASIKSAPSTL